MRAMYVILMVGCLVTGCALVVPPVNAGSDAGADVAAHCDTGPEACTIIDTQGPCTRPDGQPGVRSCGQRGDAAYWWGECR